MSLFETDHKAPQSCLDDLSLGVGRTFCDRTRNVLLTYARIWNTLETNSIQSKPGAADWVIKHLPKTYIPVMHRAKLICIGVENEYWDDISELIKPCIAFMLDKINEQIMSIDFENPSILIKLMDEK